MDLKFDQQKVKHQLLHLLIGLTVFLVCIAYMHSQSNWTKLGNIWNSLLIPFVLIGEILKVFLAHYFTSIEHSVVSSKRKRNVINFALTEIVSALMVQLLCILLFAFICVILGAPVLKNYDQTLMLSLLLTLLVISPTVFLLGGGGALQILFCENLDFLTKSEETTLHLFKISAICSTLGAWAGSIVAPLDWDRDWQIYPVPNIVGALFGNALGNIYLCTRILYTVAKACLSKKRI